MVGAFDSALDRALIGAVQDGLPLTPRPYATIAADLGLAEPTVIARLQAMLEEGVIKRLGVVVRHHELGFKSNAMVVWDVPDERVESAGARLGDFPWVTLCYQRPRRLPVWPYNLYCMIHGTSRELVDRRIETLAACEEVEGVPRAVLFSRRRFKQRGARYVRREGDRDRG